MTRGQAFGLRLVAMLIVGAPIVWYSWRWLNEVLSGRTHPGPLLIAASLLAALSSGAWRFARSGPPADRRVQAARRRAGGPSAGGVALELPPAGAVFVLMLYLIAFAAIWGAMYLILMSR